METLLSIFVPLINEYLFNYLFLIYSKFYLYEGIYRYNCLTVGSAYILDKTILNPFQLNQSFN